MPRRAPRKSSRCLICSSVPLSQMPQLFAWLRMFALPSVAAILATYAALRWTQRHALGTSVAVIDDIAPLSSTGKLAACGILFTAFVLLTASALDWPLGLPTFIAGVVVAALVLLIARCSPWPVLRDISWSVLPLVAGLFILVEGLNRTGVLSAFAEELKRATTLSPHAASWGSGIVSAIASNLINNLPMGLIAATTTQTAQSSPHITGAVLIGVD